MSEGGEEGQDSRVREFPCPGCGAKLEFDPKVEALRCRHCGHQDPLGTHLSSDVVTHAFEAARQRARTHATADGTHDALVVHCQSCGAQSLVEAQATRCPFCDSPVVVEAGTETLIRPESVLPFSVDKRAADEAFTKWVRSRWFAPNDLAARATRRGMDGVYLPHWAYDSKTMTRYVGQRGTYYYVSETYTDKKGERKTRQVRKTRWRPATGVVHVGFRDVLVCGSKSLPSNLVQRLEPWDLRGLRPYEPGYLSGFFAERYRVGLEEGFEFAKDRMEPRIRARIRGDIGGDTQRIWTIRVHHDDVGFKHFLLPLWISSFRYDDKVYRFVVNARTGDAVGERPYSIWKIALAVAAALLVVGLIAWLVNRPEPEPEPPPPDAVAAALDRAPQQ